MELVKKARAFATVAHAGVYRKYTGEPYIEHPKRVAGRLAEMGFPEHVVAAAYLHDVVEDTPVSNAELAAEFGPEVAALVAEVTKPVMSYATTTRAYRKAAFREHLKKATYYGACIKLSDELDNSRNVAELAPKFAKVYLPELLEELGVLSHGHPELVTELAAHLEKTIA